MTSQPVDVKFIYTFGRNQKEHYINIPDRFYYS